MSEDIRKQKQPSFFALKRLSNKLKLVFTS